MKSENAFEKGLISVIVPAYNVREYLGMCIDSICAQTYRKLEIIIVDDGSDDGTGDLCDLLKDSRITIIHQQNRGLSGARNTGLNKASGEYVAFIDSDDYIRETMLEELYTAIEIYKADLAACGVEYLRCDNGTSTYSGQSGSINVLEYNESLEYLCQRYYFNVWNKLYRHKVIDCLRFVEGVICEDVGYMVDVFQRIQRTVYIDKPLYVYRLKRPGSISGLVFDSRKLPAVEEYERFIEFLRSHGYTDILPKVRRNQLAMIRSLYNETEDNDKENRKKMYRLYKDKLVLDGVIRYRLFSNLYFLICPGIVRKRYQKDKQRI